MHTLVIDSKQLFDKYVLKAEFYLNDVVKIKHRYKTYKLNELLDIKNDFCQPSEFMGDNIMYIGLENVESNTGRLVGVYNVSSTSIKSRSKVFSAGDILFSRLRPNLNKVLLVPDHLKHGYCSTEFYVFRNKTKNIGNELIAFLLRSKYVLQKVVNLRTGSALPRVMITDLLELEIPIPPKGITDLLENYLKINMEVLNIIKTLSRNIYQQIENDVITNIDKGANDLKSNKSIIKGINDINNLLKQL